MAAGTRRAFTLVEMLIATGIFIVGFASLYGLFLAGSRYQQKAGSLTRMALAATSLVDTLRLRAIPGDAPELYEGDGHPDTAEDHFVPYPDEPRIWYRFVNATDILGGQDPALAFHLELQVIDIGRTGGDELDLEAIDDRYRISANIDSYLPGFTAEQRSAYETLPPGSGSRLSPEQLVFVLKSRGLLLERDAVVNRRSL